MKDKRRIVQNVILLVKKQSISTSHFQRLRIGTFIRGDGTGVGRSRTAVAGRLAAVGCTLVLIDVVGSGIDVSRGCVLGISLFVAGDGNSVRLVVGI